MHDFDTAAKEIFNLSDRAIIPFLNANLGASHPPDARVVRANTEHRLPSRATGKPLRDKTIIADAVFLVDGTDYCHVEVQLDRRAGMALRVFRYDVAEALEHPVEEGGVQTISFPKSLVIYLEPNPRAPDHELLRVRFPDDFDYEYRTPAIKLPELSVKELAERHLVIFMPLYILKLRRQVKRAKTREERQALAAELKQLYQELGKALRQEKEAGNMTEADRDKILRMTEALHEKVFGAYNEFEEEQMDWTSDLRLIEKLHAELDEAASRMAELERAREEERRAREEERQAREEAVSRMRDTARNILKAGQPVEQVAQWTGLPPETVRTLAEQLAANG
jgi:hypothetical protein